MTRMIRFPSDAYWKITLAVSADSLAHASHHHNVVTLDVLLTLFSYELVGMSHDRKWIISVWTMSNTFNLGKATWENCQHDNYDYLERCGFNKIHLEKVSISALLGFCWGICYRVDCKLFSWHIWPSLDSWCPPPQLKTWPQHVFL